MIRRSLKFWKTLFVFGGLFLCMYVLIVYLLNLGEKIEAKKILQNPEILRDLTYESTKEEFAHLAKMETYDSNDRTQRELQETKAKLAELEKKIAILEGRVPQKYPDVKFLGVKERKRILVTGGAGFVGSHLVDILMMQGHEVIVVDNFFTGRKRNVEHWFGHRNFEMIHHDIVNPLYVEADEIYHLASPASPPHYMQNPVKTIKTNTLGTINMLDHKTFVIESGIEPAISCVASGPLINIFQLFGYPMGTLNFSGIKRSLCFNPGYKLSWYKLSPEFVQPLKREGVTKIHTYIGLARRVGAKILIASTSEVYGDPMVHPQPESYWGHVNPIGPRACYDEGKRVAETLAYSYAKQEKVSVRVARIFNTYGPRMHVSDGRVVSNFVLQALQNLTITVYGNGKQTRSFCYVSDLVDGLLALMASSYTLPVNIGNPVEHTIEEFAVIIKNLVPGCRSMVATGAAVEDDPQRRRPDIALAKSQLNWEPKISLQEGLQRTIDYFKEELSRTTFYNNQTYMDVKTKAHH